MTDWKTYIGETPWTAEKQTRIAYNEGDHIATYENPVWTMDDPTGVPITDTHLPGKYWGSEPAEITIPPVGGTLWATGRNNYGQFGDDSKGDEWELKQVKTDTDWYQLACSERYTMALKTTGTLWGTGQNSSYQLGLGDQLERLVFTQESSGATNWSQVSCGGSHSVALKTNGTLWGTGESNNGEAGLGVPYVTEFTQIGSDNKWSQVACGEMHTMAIKTDGTLWGTGYNIYGSLGVGDTTKRDEFTQVGSVTNWAKVACGTYFTIAIRTDGSLWSTGYNYYGTLGLNDTSNRNAFNQVGSSTDWEDIGCGAYQSMAIKDGELWMAGENTYGALGVGDNTDRDELTQEIAEDGNWSQVDGGAHSAGLKTNGMIFTTGYNAYGQLGLNDDTNRDEFELTSVDTGWIHISCGTYHTMAIKEE